MLLDAEDDKLGRFDDGYADQGDHLAGFTHVVVEKVERDAVDIAVMHVKVVIRLGLDACRRSGPKVALLEQRDEPGLDQRRLARSGWRAQ